MDNKFDQTYSYKLIYVFSIPDDDHKGLLKVGEATIKTDLKPDTLVPDCHVLNQAAKARIDGYTATASIKYNLLHTELAWYVSDGYSHTFKDKDVHKVLMNSGIHKVQPNGATGEEWFAASLETVVSAIKAVKCGNASLPSCAKALPVSLPKIDFREEQKDAIEKTIKAFKK